MNKERDQRLDVAAQMVQGLLSTGECGGWNAYELARAAVELADALIEEVRATTK